MGVFIFSELKRRCFNRKTTFMILLIIILSISFVNKINVDSVFTDEEILYEELKSLTNIYAGGRRPLEITDKMMISKNIDDKIDISLWNMKEAIDGKKNNDYFKEKGRFLALNSRLSLGIDKSLEGNSSILSSFKDDYEMYWNEVFPDIGFYEIEGLPVNYGEFFDAGPRLTMESSKLAFNKYTYESDYILGSKVDGPLFIYYYFKEILPLLIPLLILILTFDSINDDINSESIKLILTNIRSRNYYILIKNIVGVVHSFIVIILPGIFLFLYYGIKEGFTSLNFPVLYLERGSRSIKPIYNLIETMEDNFGLKYKMGLNNLSLYADPKGWIYKFSDSFNYIHEDLKFTKLISLILLSVVILLFIIIFFVAFSNLISTIFENKVTSFSIGVCLVTVLSVVSTILTKINFINFSPFSQNNPIRIIEGTYNSTWLLSIIILSISSIILILSNMIYMNKKDI